MKSFRNKSNETVDHNATFSHNFHANWTENRIANTYRTREATQKVYNFYGSRHLDGRSHSPPGRNLDLNDLEYYSIK